jgi:hypothetical protein
MKQAVLMGMAMTAMLTLALARGAPAGADVTDSDAAAIVGGADCGDTYQYKTIACTDTVFRHYDADTNCMSGSYEAYASTGTGTRQPDFQGYKSCYVCGALCNQNPLAVYSHKPKTCNGSTL